MDHSYPPSKWHQVSHGIFRVLIDFHPRTSHLTISFSTCRLQERRIISWSRNRYCSCFMCTCCTVFAATPIERLPGRKGTRRQRWDWRHKYLTCLIVRVSWRFRFVLSGWFWDSLFVTELRGLDLQTGYFTLRQIKHATNNFDTANKIGEGGFGPVYKVFMHFQSIINLVMHSEA
jgi:hypothetical protein